MITNNTQNKSNYLGKVQHIPKELTTKEHLITFIPSEYKKSNYPLQNKHHLLGHSEEMANTPIVCLAIHVSVFIHSRSFIWNVGSKEWGELQELSK